MIAEPASFILDVMYPVNIVVWLVTCGILFYYAHPWPALSCLVPVGLSGACIRYRLKVAHYYLGRHR